jgi:hypothetical protein
MKLDLRFLNRPVEDLWCQAIVLLVFQGPSIVNEVLLNINDKMGGSLSDIINMGVWTGERGENFLLATQDAIRADKLMMRGLGPEGEFGIEVLIKEISETGSVLDRMGVKEFGINLPSADGRVSEYGLYLETAAIGLVEAFYNRHRDDPDFLLKIFFSIDKDSMNAVDPLIKRLKENMRPGLDFSVISDRQVKEGDEEDILKK